jgi:raffinose/stachyose/melibiose transport system permease protein
MGLKTIKNKLQPKGWIIATILALPVGLYIFMVIVPIFFAGRFSLFNWGGGKRMEYIGIANYIEALTSPAFWSAFKNTIIFTVLMVIGQVGIAFILTLFFSMKWMRFNEFHRRVMFFPSIIAAVVIGLVWQVIYSNQVGILNELLRWIRREDLIRQWLGDSHIALYSVSVPVIWQFVGYYLVILTSAVASIPPDILEVAEIDGANGWKRSFYITVPMIWSSIKICVMICFAGSFRAFDHISVMTAGGPGSSTTVLALYNYDVSFRLMRFGYGSAVAVIILVFSLILTVGSRAILGGKRYE